MFKDPVQFETQYVHLGKIIELKNLRRAWPGGPRVGSLVIGGKDIFHRVSFGGPMLFHGDYLFLPMVRNNDMDVRFSVCAINFETYAMSVSYEKYDALVLERVENGRLVYYDNLDKPEEKSTDLLWVF